MLRAPYDRSGLTTGIVHIGVGGFHRAHQARYVDELLSQGKAQEFAICGVGVLPGDARMQQALREQQGLYSLVVKHPDGSLDRHVVGSVLDMLMATTELEPVVERLAHPQTRIVSLTVTEGGYAVPSRDQLSWFRLVTESLARRRARGIPPYTVMSCDNVPGNGEVARRALLAYTEDEALLEGVAFPSSMVDRITPVTTDADRELLAAEDAWPVVCEPWSQWVLEDEFGLGRPPLEDVGVQLVGDVEPYELMKLRLLNGSHQALAYLGHLAGYELVHEVCADPLFVGFLQTLMDREVTPTLRPVPGVDLDAYKRSLLERFANPAIRDTVARLCADSSNRIPPWLVPVVREQLAGGGEVTRLALVLASWARYAEGVDESGRPIEVVDPRKDLVMAAAARQRAEPTALLRERSLFGDLVEHPRLVAAYTWALGSLHERGAVATLQELATR